MKESKWWVIAFILAVVASAAGSLVYDSGVFRKKVAVVPDSAYVRHFTSARQLFVDHGRAVIGDCSDQDVTLRVTGDTVLLTSPGRAALGYKPLGVNSESGLVCLRGDSAQVIFYRYKDKRDTLKHMILLEQPSGPSMLFFELSPCPEIEK